jgi:hypothetical protein
VVLYKALNIRSDSTQASWRKYYEAKVHEGAQKVADVWSIVGKPQEHAVAAKLAFSKFQQGDKSFF